MSSSELPVFDMTSTPLSFERDVRFLFFSSRTLRHDFEEFRMKEVSSCALGIIVIISTIVQLFFAVVASSKDSDTFIVAVRYIRLCSLIPVWLYWLQSLSHYIFIPRWFYCWNSSRILADLSSCSIVISLGFVLMGRSIVGSCSHSSSNFNCNPEHEVTAMPQDALIGLIVGLISVQALLKPRWEALAISWAFMIVAIGVSIAAIGAQVSPLLPFACILTLIVLYEYERNVIRMYFALRNAEHSIRTRMHAENEKQVMEMRSVEMRHLLGNVAHDLKTPMQSFVLDLEYLDKKLKNPLQRTAEYVAYSLDEMRRIMESVQNLIDTNSFMYMVINRAIDYTKSSSGHVLVPSLETINVTESIQWAINIVKTKSRVPIIFEPLPVSVCSNIITDKQWLIENILCLVSNAAKFTMHGSVTIRCELQSETHSDHPVQTPHLDDIAADEESENVSSITSSAASTTGGGGEKSVSMISLELSRPTQQQWLVIEVEDTGIGIPADKKEFMFQPFKQAMRMAGGTGLGLYSMSLRVKALGGECGLSDNKHGECGTCFWFKLPYRADIDTVGRKSKTLGTNCSVHLDFGSRVTSSDEEKEPSPRIDDAIASVATTVPPRTPRTLVLLVDDSLTIRKSISRALCHENLSVDLAENGQMALEMIALKKYDLVLMDLQMPVMDGLEAVRRLRELENEAGNCNHLTVIGISAYNGDPYSSEALKAGMDGFIEKPFSARRFFDFCEAHNIFGVAAPLHTLNK